MASSMHQEITIAVVTSSPPLECWNILVVQKQDKYEALFFVFFYIQQLESLDEMFHFYAPWKCQKTSGFLGRSFLIFHFFDLSEINLPVLSILLVVHWPQWCNQDPVKRLRWSSLTGFWIGFFCSLYNHLAVNINPAETGFIDASETFEIKTNSENEYYKLTIKVPGRLCFRINSVAWIVFFTWTARIVFLSIRRDMKGRHDR